VCRYDCLRDFVVSYYEPGLNDLKCPAWPVRPDPQKQGNQTLSTL